MRGKWLLRSREACVHGHVWPSGYSSSLQPPLTPESTFTGVVKDTSGAVLPGVTVEAASPALIEKMRSAVTDGTGGYRIVDSPARHLHAHLHAAEGSRR